MDYDLTNNESFNTESDYFAVDVEIENIGDTEYEYVTTDIKAFNSDGLEISDLFRLQQEDIDKYTILKESDMRPGAEISGTIVRMIEKGEKPAEFIFESDSRENGDKLLIKLDN